MTTYPCCPCCGQTPGARCNMPAPRPPWVGHDEPCAEHQRPVQCPERESGGVQCSFVGPPGAEHRHYVAGI